MMLDVLGGECRRFSCIQVLIAGVCYQVPSVNQNSFLGSLNRRKVCLHQCGKDRVLVIPYLSKIVFHIRYGNSVRYHDMKTLQPFKGYYNYGAVRRAANILPGMYYPKAGHPVVNETAVHLIREYAEKTVLFSHRLRKHLLSVMFLRDRVDIDKLSISAHEVFEHDEVMANAIMRLYLCNFT